MDQSASRTVREIQEIRDRLDDEFDALGRSLPPRDAIVRRLAIAAVGGAATALALWYVAHRLRVRSEERRVKRLVREALHEAGVGS